MTNIELPDKTFLYLEELAERWSVEEDLVSHYVDEAGLRRAFRLRDGKHYVVKRESGPESGDSGYSTSLLQPSKVSIKDRETGDTHTDQWLYIRPWEPILSPPAQESLDDTFVVGPYAAKPIKVIAESFNNRELVAKVEGYEGVFDIAYSQFVPVFTMEEIHRFEGQLGKPLGVRERNNLERTIALLVHELSIRASHFSINDKPNFDQIAKQLSERLENRDEKEPSQRTLREKLSRAYKSLYPD